MSSTYGSAGYVKMKIATSVGQYKKVMKGQIPIEDASQKKNGKILRYLCILVPAMNISLICKTLE